MKKSILVISLIILSISASSQVLITLLLGDKLNSDKLEFGLDGGINFLAISNVPTSKTLTNWNLGFYFDFKLKEKIYFHTGVLVKSKMGASGITPYSLNNPHLDSLFVGGNVDRMINYFNVPAMLRYRVINYFHIEGGVMFGLKSKSYDLFTNTVYKQDDLKFKNDTKTNYTALDAGAIVGIGYKFMKGQGITLSSRYYLGLVDIDKTMVGSQNNSALYISLSIPIGKNKKENKL